MFRSDLLTGQSRGQPPSHPPPPAELPIESAYADFIGTRKRSPAGSVSGPARACSRSRRPYLYPRHDDAADRRGPGLGSWRGRNDTPQIQAHPWHHPSRPSAGRVQPPGLLGSCANLGSCLRRLQPLTYDAAGRPTADSGTAGWFAGLTLTNHFDPALGREALSLRLSGTNVLAVSYGYDAQGRLNAVTNGPDAAAYTYAANSDRLATTAFGHNGAQVLATRRT